MGKSFFSGSPSKAPVWCNSTDGGSNPQRHVISLSLITPQHMVVGEMLAAPSVARRCKFVNKLSKSQNLTTKLSLQVFLLTVVFGLFHGLIFLPVILTILGPSHKSVDSGDKYDASASDATNSTTDHEIPPPAMRNVTPGDTAKTVDVVGNGLVNPAFVRDATEVST